MDAMGVAADLSDKSGPKLFAKLSVDNTKSVTRTLKKLHTSNETSWSSSDYLQLPPFSKWELLLKERICSQRDQILSFLVLFLMFNNFIYT